MTFEDDDVYRINRANVALLLHIKPQEVDDMPLCDVHDVLQIENANRQIANWQASRKR